MQTSTACKYLSLLMLRCFKGPLSSHLQQKKDFKRRLHILQLPLLFNGNSQCSAFPTMSPHPTLSPKATSRWGWLQELRVPSSTPTCRGQGEEGRGEEEEGGRRPLSPGSARLDGVLRGGQRHLVHDEHHHLGLLVGGQCAGEGPCGDKNALAVCKEQPSTLRSTQCLGVCLSGPP